MKAAPKVMAYFPGLLDRTASHAMADRCQALIAERGWGLWAVQIKATEQLAGFTGLHMPVAEWPFSPCVEIGRRLAFQHWGKDFATEAANGALRVGFLQLDLAEIVSFTAIANNRSRAVMERLNMSDTIDIIDHPALSLDSPLRKHCLYRLSRTQWRNNHTGL